ncbi:BlaR1 family beta-lactam sensor/signal transducer [Shouchella patagoniensis]|uniref:BlaR1 family beta-lactam sensor/signal transducer n=1 Tax=Shouchella patagoniensis TaxID=228576 RepID=UPI000994C3CE|nr:BlaR1 family beta-lactam sensor/signal transducer [Shouchella patagoniensis]
MVFSQIALSLVLSTVTIGIVFFIRNVFQKHLSLKWRYRMWYLVLAALTLPFLPIKQVQGLSSFFSQAVHSQDSGSESAALQQGTTTTTDWMADFGASVSQADYTWIQSGFLLAWVIGMAWFTWVTIHSAYRLNRLICLSTSVENKAVLTQYEWCLEQVQLKSKPILLESSLIKSPLTYGLFHTYLVVPHQMDKQLNDTDIKHILLHELHHVKHHHPKTNYLFVLFQIIYWFHPFVWKAFSEMRLDRELSCDAGVLDSLGARSSKAYGLTILRFIEKKNNHASFSGLINGFGGAKKQIKKRIEHIVSFQTDTTARGIKSALLFSAIGIFVVSQIPFLAAVAATENDYVFSGNHVVSEELGTYFDGKTASFVLYSQNKDQYEIYNKEQSTKRVSPNSTYKIYSALIGLETNAIQPEQTAMTWDGTYYEYDEWNQDQTLETAMGHSVNWYFQEIDQHVQQEAIQSYVNQLNYGNRNVASTENPFWLESSLTISPIEQVELLNAVFTNEQFFHTEAIDTVKNAMKVAEQPDRTLYGKTGTGIINNEAVNGWFIGFVETSEDTWFFATNIQEDEEAWGSEAAQATYAILEDKGIYKGGN